MLPTTPSSNGHLQQAWLICQFELIRLFFTKRGAILLIAFSVVWFLILKYPVFESVKILSNPNFGENITVFSSQLNLQQIVQWPYSELAVYWLFAVFAFPITSVLMSSDQLASDTNRGTVRFLLLRSTRSQLLYGRFFGQVLIIASLITMTALAALIMGMVRDISLLSSSFDELANIGLNLLISCLPFIALTSLLNVISKSSKLSVVLIVILIPVLTGLISYLTQYISFIEYLLWIIPGLQLTETVQGLGFSVNTTLLPLAQTAVYLAICHLTLTRRAL
ncbi:ABC transporter permease subunit [Psychrobium sp. 1_MG-2023]|uniref:ABC transporter permease subunit n=1 Tax=Psychrobium sp. 1_MG-2023 TaxID=3062624 RepID=UPI000C3413A0|nr:ABC transporter permease subunit [Psychrobium sp. 1_MG-2023]MDP2561071.1 ABC transporter permease subunit [Psychrobium sp. 1_MG-2023]PKF58361.1 hypothetical protein CW748_04155 [Alteromonadales bacterium alter-6D02]